MKIAIKSIELERVEGIVGECHKTIVRTMADAESTLGRWAQSAPGKGYGYHKCDFCVTFEDGETYRGRYDLSVDRSADAPSLREHILRHVRFYAGAYINELPSFLSHMTMDGYLRIIGWLTEEERAAYAAFLETYEL